MNFSSKSTNCEICQKDIGLQKCTPTYYLFIYNLLWCNAPVRAWYWLLFICLL